MGLAVTIHGAGFTGVGFERGPSVIHLGPTNGPTNVTDIVVVSSTQITCKLPDRDPNWPASVSLWITTPLGSGVRHGAFKFFEPEPPVLSKITPSSGDFRGGTTVVLLGKGFTDADLVEFDCFGEVVPMRSFNVDSDTQITAVTNGGVQFAPYGVRVRTPLGVATLHVNDLHPAWSFIDTTPVFSVDSVTPNHGTIMGGTPLVVSGQLLSLVAAIQWEGLTPPPGGWTLVGETELDMLSLDFASDGLGTPGVPGTNVIWFYTGVPFLALDYTFDAFAAQSLSLDEVGIAGGETVSIFGTSMDYATILEVDGVGHAFTVVSEHEISFVTPAHAAGEVTIHLEGDDLGYGVLTTDININFA